MLLKKCSARSLTANWIGQGVAVLVGLFIPALVIRTLGAERYGVWALVVSIVGHMSLPDFGVRHALVRQTASLHAQGRDAAISGLLRSTTRLLMLFGTVGLVAIAIIAICFSSLFVIPQDLLLIAQIMLGILAVDAVVDLVTGPYSAALGGIERYDLLQLCNTGRLLLNAASTWLFLSLGWGLAGVVAALLVSRIAFRVAVLVCLKRLIPRGSDSDPHEENVGSIRALFSFGIWTTVMIMSARISYQLDLIVVGAWVGAAGVAAYAIPLILIDQLRALYDSASLVLFSRLSKISPQTWKEDAGGFLDRWCRYSSLLPLIVGLHLVVFGEDFIALWVGYRVPEAGAILTLLVLPLFFSVPMGGCSAALLALGKPHIVAAVSLLEAVVNLIASIRLVPQLGIVGVAWGTFIAAVLVQGVIALLFVPKKASYSFLRFSRAAFGLTLPLIIVYLLALTLSRMWVGNHGVWPFLIGNGVPLVLMVPMVLLCVVSKEDRGYLLWQLARMDPSCPAKRT